MTDLSFELSCSMKDENLMENYLSAMGLDVGILYKFSKSSRNPYRNRILIQFSGPY